MTVMAASGSMKEILNRFLFFTGMGAVATKGLSLHYLLIWVIATGMVLLWNLTGNLLWTFRKEKDHGA